MTKNSSVPEAPAKPSSSYKIGDRTVANVYWNGNDYVTQYNPTESEQSAMDYLDAAIPQAYRDATNSNGIEAYKNNWIKNQTKQYNKLADTNLANLKDSLITGGQVGSSTGWNKIRSFLDSYNDALSNISANADYNALNYQSGLLDYANALQGSMNNYYNLANTISQNTAGNQNTAWNQNVQDFQNQMAVYQANQAANANKNSLLSTGLSLAGTVAGSMLGPLGSMAGGAIGNAVGKLASKTGK